MYFSLAIRRITGYNTINEENPCVVMNVVVLKASLVGAFFYLGELNGDY